MVQAGLNSDLIIRKIQDSVGDFDTSTEGLIALKKAGVSNEIVELMMDSKVAEKSKSTNKKPTGYSDSQPITYDTFYETPLTRKSRIVLDSKEAIKNAKTIAIKKSSLHPSRQSLEKELLKRKEWKELNLNIVRYKHDADLLIEIGYVSMSWLSHRYTYRIYDNKSGTVITAGETTSWGSLSENLARGVAKRLKKAMEAKNSH